MSCTTFERNVVLPSVELIGEWRASGRGYVALVGDEGAGGCFDDVVGDGVELVDLQDASDLGEEALEEAEVASGDAFDRGDGLGVGEVFGVEVLAEGASPAFEDEDQFFLGQGRYSCAKPTRL